MSHAIYVSRDPCQYHWSDNYHIAYQCATGEQFGRDLDDDEVSSEITMMFADSNHD